MKLRSTVLISLQRLLFCSLLCVAVPSADAQKHISAVLFKPAPAPQESFFLRLPDSLKGDSASSRLLDSKSPTTAVLLSAVLPGAGQIYTGRYWTVPIILGFGGYFASTWIRQNNHYLDARSKYQESVDAGENNGQGNAQLLRERDFYHDDRDRFAFYFAITYLLNLVDAYVGASLYTFDVGDNLGSTSVKISIPIH